MEKLLEFIKDQQLMVIASRGEKDIWVTNVYFVADEKMTIYFISPEDAKHSRMILKDPNIAFSVAWFEPGNHKNREGVQGLGICRLAKNISEITAGIKLLYERFPDLRDVLTVEWILKNAWSTKVWVLKPNYMKHWDDEIYGDDESEEFIIS